MSQELELDVRSLKVKELETKLLEKSHVSVTSPPCEVSGTLKGKLFHATKENTELKQEVAYLTSHPERTVVSEKMIEDDLNHVEQNATKSTNKLGVGFQRCEDKGDVTLSFKAKTECIPLCVLGSFFHT
jgi:hypothetical protein